MERSGAVGVSTAATWKGSVNQKVLPTPSSLSTPSSPPMAVTSCWQIARPRPVPPNRRVVEESAWENGSNSRFRSVFSRPTPGVGDLEPDHQTVGGLTARWARTTTSPVLVNFTAFEARFNSTCRSRDGSPRRLSGSSGESGAASAPEGEAARRMFKPARHLPAPVWSEPKAAMRSR